MVHSNYTLPNRLWVHPVHVNCMEEDERVTQDRFWAMVNQVGDFSHVHARIEVGMLQPIFQGLHYRRDIADKLGRCKRRCTTPERKKKARKAQEEKEEWDSLLQRWDYLEWEQDQMDI